MSTPLIELANGHNIPQVGLGFWQVKNTLEFNTAFEASIKAGYRHFDSAQIYKNEAMLGNAWRASGIPRQELFLTTKIWVSNYKKRKLRISFKESLEKLQTDYVDLLLLHFPVTFFRRGAWKAMEEIYKSGGAKSIGVSNYTVRHLKGLKRYSKITPAVNQIELHLFLQQPKLVKYCHDNGIKIEAYSPLAHSKLMDDQVVQKVADKHNKTYAQIMLRWLIQQDCIILPKSITPQRIAENIDLFNFNLDKDDMKDLSTRDRNLRTCWSPVRVP